MPGDTVRVPYLVRVPAGYDPARPAPVVVFLHGGVISTPQFQHTNPDAVTPEPIFAAAPANALVVYPFGRTSFGWVEQPAAFAQVLRIVTAVRARYRTDPARTTLVGMSNGGSAVLWFAAQPAAPFSRYVALAPAPKLLLAQSSYGPLGKTKPVLMLSAQDDDIYAYAAVRAAYDANRAGRPNWILQTVPKDKGGHSFLYGPEGLALLQQALRSAAAKPGKR
ncbi:alpha/beta hydrolase-fold protein [Hymenobacter amundsenii]|uniref:alpha/beta hydrolase-fold protein n=1 Tax=Hymenobacter amundsenii TaxID=2006685 RepID=UPI0013FD1821|nr:alpha/beta hydrolase-fold protein [Hymenobacter amundsenii]